MRSRRQHDDADIAVRQLRSTAGIFPRSFALMKMPRVRCRMLPNFWQARPTVGL